MKKVFCILSILTISVPAFAANEGYVATAGYVKGAVTALTSEYNATSNPNGRIVISGSGDRVSNVSLVTGQDGLSRVTYTKTYESTVPVSSSNSSTRANIWVE